jgi:broad specificity phosphatase PhoE
MLTNIYLVRHGQTHSNAAGFYMGWSNEDLNQTGKEQVEKLAARLAPLPLKALDCSPLQRTLTTARIIAGPHNLEIKAIDGLKEIDLGQWQGLHEREIERRWGQLWKEWRTDPSMTLIPGGESFVQVSDRSVRALKMIIEENDGKDILIATHEIIVKIMVMYALGAPSSIYRHFQIGNASLSLIWARDGRRWLITLNDRSHQFT